ncbi:MAG: hypothetical protein ACOYJ2_05725 [Rickettsiales bacterium]
MKHVVVVHSHNFSAWFLGGQKLKNSFAVNFNSCDFVDRSLRESEEVDEDSTSLEEYHQGLQSEDGIQFYHFKKKVPKAEMPFTEEALQYWIQKLEESLPEGHSLDGIVIPCGYIDKTPPEAMINWLKEIKQRWPNLKVMVTEPHISLRTGDEAADKKAADSSYVTAASQEAADNPHFVGKVITKEDKEYQLHEMIDVATNNLSPEKTAGVLRDMLGMPDLPDLSKGR